MFVEIPLTSKYGNILRSIFTIKNSVFEYDCNRMKNNDHQDATKTRSTMKEMIVKFTMVDPSQVV